MAELIYRKEFTPDFAARPLSYSSLKAFKKSPQHFLEYIFGARKESPAMAFGSLVDVLILTPDNIDKFVVMPENIKKPTAAQVGAKNPPPATLIQIENYNQWVEANGNKTWVAQEDWDLAHFLRDKTFDNAKAKELLGRVVSTQRKLNWNEKETGLPMVGYLDMEGDTFIGDLKTAQDGSPDGFMRAAYDYGYHIQAGAYRDAMVVKYGKYMDFFHLVIETNPPYNISVFKAAKDFLELGAGEYHEALQEIKHCIEHNLWYQGYEFHTATGYHQLDVPYWAKKKLDRYK